MISIIVPVYNEEKYIIQCLESLCAQSNVDKKFEIVVIDDGSTDRSYDRVKSFISSHKGPVRVYKKDHEGAGAARNAGAQRAKGSILVFADADMIYDKNYVSTLVKPILSKKTLGTSHIDEQVANPENIWSQCWSINADLEPGQRTRLSVKIVNVFRALRKSEFDRVGGFDTDKGYFDDGSLYAKLGYHPQIVKDAKAFHYNPETLKEVFFSTRWIGRSAQIERSIANLLRYSCVNSLRNSIRKIRQGAPVRYTIFKCVYDFGMFIGILGGIKHEK